MENKRNLDTIKEKMEHLRITQANIPHYNGHNMQYPQWRFAVEGCIEYNKWSLTDAVFQIVLNTSGEARNKLQNFSSMIFTTKAQLINNLDEAILGADIKGKAVKDVLSLKRKANQTLDDYANELQWAIKHSEIPAAEDYAIKTFKEGHGVPSIADHLNGRSFDKLEKILSSAKDILKGQQERTNAQAPEELPRQNFANFANFAQASTSINQEEPMEIGAIRMVNRCWTCNRVGHFAQSCPNWNKGRGSYRARARGNATSRKILRCILQERIHI